MPHSVRRQLHQTTKTPASPNIAQRARPPADLTPAPPVVGADAAAIVSIGFVFEDDFEVVLEDDGEIELDEAGVGVAVVVVAVVISLGAAVVVAVLKN